MIENGRKTCFMNFNNTLNFYRFRYSRALSSLASQRKVAEVADFGS